MTHENKLIDTNILVYAYDVSEKETNNSKAIMANPIPDKLLFLICVGFSSPSGVRWVNTTSKTF